ncbi:hypothetical protein HY643_05015 [Candidatus Woesearchaeota archaeon]|nr:hypothetical protein [Candidatus Woesearchaeota archaeon]
MEKLEDYLTKEGWKKDWQQTKENFQTKKEHINENFTLITQGVAAVMYGTNELLQHMAKNGTIEYQSFMGQTSDVAASAMFTAWFMRSIPQIFDTNKKGVCSKSLQKAAAFTPPILLTIYELYSPYPFTFDPLDIPAYFLGSVVAYTIIKKTSKKSKK